MRALSTKTEPFMGVKRRCAVGSQGRKRVKAACLLSQGSVPLESRQRACVSRQHAACILSAWQRTLSTAMEPLAGAKDSLSLSLSLSAS